MQKIIPHLWFDKEAKQAADFYVSVFPDGVINHYSVIKDTPSGDAETVSFSLMGFNFMAISAGPYFKVNPSVSFMVNFDPSKDSEATTRIDEIWDKLSEGGKVMMPLQKYPFSERYGWVEDRFGVSWQLILTNPAGEERPPIIPSLMFTKDVSGKAEEATNYYISVFKNSKRGQLAKYGPGSEPEDPNNVMFTDFMLEGQWFAAMDSSRQHEFNFTEGVSLLVECEDQEEIDYFWGKLSAVPQAEQCGWLKDKYGLSWQIAPKQMQEYMNGTPEQVARVTKSFLAMKKFNLAELEKAYKGE
jgi:predicted 3-demethylubiquinone-9 3-methyltransferase (glyoxalase superfamily)